MPARIFDKPCSAAPRDVSAKSGTAPAVSAPTFAILLIVRYAHPAIDVAIKDGWFTGLIARVRVLKSVEVIPAAHDPAPDAGRAGRNRGLIHNKDILAGTSAALFRHLGEMEPGAQPVNPGGTNDGIFDG